MAHSVSGITEIPSFSITNHQSGSTTADFYVAIVDKFGQIVKNKNDDKLSITLSVISASSYNPVASTSVDIRSQNGLFNVTGLQLIAEPGTSVTLQISSDALFDTTLPDVIEFKTSNGGSLVLASSLSLRSCIAG